MAAVGAKQVRYGTIRIQHELLDYVIVSFCKTLGDTDNGIEIVKDQLVIENIDYEYLTMDKIMALIKRLVTLTKELKDSNTARQFRKDVLRAYTICKNT